MKTRVNLALERLTELVEHYKVDQFVVITKEYEQYKWTSRS